MTAPTQTLATYGWNDIRMADWQTRTTAGLVPARITADYGQHYTIATPDQLSARMSGAAVHKLKSVDMPKIGDWVAVEITETDAIIHEVLPRTSEIVRGQVGRMVDKQVIAANVDVAFIVQPLDHDFSPERLERYIFQLSAQGITTVILLNKSDTVLDAADKQAELASLGMNNTLIMSATNDSDMRPLEHYISPGQTVVILGSSGAGKSTLTNRLLGDQVQATAEIRAKDSKGRHTTVHRQLFVLPSGGMIIDTPGIRELQLWGTETDLERSFADIIEVIRTCRYRNCSHSGEAGCAVAAGLSDGSIDARRYRIYCGFRQELQALDNRRGFIAERRSQQSRASAKRRRARTMRDQHDAHDDE